MTALTIFSTISLFFVSSALAAIPNYIHVCKRNDPHLDRCILKSVEALRPKLRQGIPELEVPPLEPLVLKDMSVNHGGNLLKFHGTEFVVHGASNFEITDFKTDLENLSFNVKLRFNKLVIDAVYEVIGKFLSFNIHGKGPVHVLAEDIDGKAIIKGKKFIKDGSEYFALDSLELKLNWKNYEVKLSDGFFKDPAINEAVNVALHENKRDIIVLIRPRIEEMVKDVLLDIGNKITTKFTYDELFPAN